MKKPIYIIAHKCNSLNSIVSAVRQGANAVECDVWHDENNEWWVDHGRKKKLSLEKLLLKTGAKRKNFKKDFTLIILDIKTPTSLETLVNVVHENQVPNLKIIYSVSKAKEGEQFSRIINLLNSNEGISIDEEEDLHNVTALFSKLQFTRTWCGNGITSLLSNLDKHHEFLQAAGDERNRTAIIKKTYIWTLESVDTMKEFLYKDDVDAVMVNRNGFFRKPIKNLLKILRASTLFRKATIQDEVFENGYFNQVSQGETTPSMHY